MTRLGIVVVGLTLILALAACTRTLERVVVVTPTPAATPTLTAQESAYIEAVATAEKEATAETMAHMRETVAAMPTSTPRPTPTPVPPPYKLALISARCYSESRFIICEGFVKNITSKPLEDIEAVVTIMDSDKRPFSSADALIDYNPLLPDQQSPFTIYADYNPAFAYWTIEFKEFFGGTILTRDDRQ
jgi:hypothetical protein